MEFIDIINAAPLVSVDLIIQNKNKEILLGKRLNRPAKGFWFAPGGRIKKNETLDNAIARVSQTELGMTLKKQNSWFLGGYDHIYTDNYLNKDNINTHYVALGYAFMLSENPKIKIDVQHSEITWLSVEELLNHPEVHSNMKAYFNQTDFFKNPPV
ncbi:MAG: GDP-mannose mannosyl hydrolase [Methylococcales bacterium]